MQLTNMTPVPRITKKDKTGVYFITMTTIEWIDIFTKKEYFEVLCDSLNYCIRHKGLMIYEYVFMTNHIHFIAGVADSRAVLVQDRAIEPANADRSETPSIKPLTQPVGSTTPPGAKIHTLVGKIHTLAGSTTPPGAKIHTLAGSTTPPGAKIHTLAGSTTPPGAKIHTLAGSTALPGAKIHTLAGSTALPGARNGLDSIIRDFKSYTTHQIKKLLHKDNRKYILRLIKNSFRKKQHSEFQIWQRENYPVTIETDNFLNTKIEYIWNNPVKKGYVYHPEDWLYSSARQKLLESDNIRSDFKIICAEW